MLDSTSPLMRDMVLARREIENGFSAACAQDGEVIYREKGQRLMPVYKIYKKVKEKSQKGQGSSVAFADTVVGLAAFRLAALFGAKAMWGEVVSELALKEGERRGIIVRYKTLVPKILNESQTDLCPMEKLSSSVKSDIEFLDAFESRLLG